jgi:hypothetical protein
LRSLVARLKNGPYPPLLAHKFGRRTTV